MPCAFWLFYKEITNLTTDSQMMPLTRQALPRAQGEKAKYETIQEAARRVFEKNRQAGAL